MLPRALLLLKRHDILNTLFRFDKVFLWRRRKHAQQHFARRSQRAASIINKKC